jgi:hypothetical protein
MLPLQSTDSAANAIERVRYTHDGMIDVIIAKPDVSGAQLAEHFGYTQAWISRIVCSDAFQARLAERKTEIISPVLQATFEERLKGMAMQSLDIIEAKLAKKNPVTGEYGDVTTAFKALEISTRSLGYGARAVNVAVQNNINVKTASDEQLMEIAQGA